MSLRIIQIHAKKSEDAAVADAIEKHKVIDNWKVGESGRKVSYHMLVETSDTQPLLDRLQTIFGKQRIIVLPVEATLPKYKQEKSEEKKPFFKGGTISREELVDDIIKGCSLDGNFLLLVFFSTIVAAIGLLADNIAVVIGVMVIAPLLGPNLALALATALGDRNLMIGTIKTNLIGVTMTITLSFFIGWLWPFELSSRELLLRTDVGFDSLALALASGAAAVLSLTTGLPSVLVGVMVAVALLPPAATFGITLGTQEYALAWGAGLLLAINVVCVNIAAKLVLLFKGISPRTWYEKKKAKSSTFWSMSAWLVSLLILILAVYLYNNKG